MECHHLKVSDEEMSETLLGPFRIPGVEAAYCGTRGECNNASRGTAAWPLNRPRQATRFARSSTSRIRRSLPQLLELEGPHEAHHLRAPVAEMGEDTSEHGCTDTCVGEGSPQDRWIQTAETGDTGKRPDWVTV